MRERLEKLQGEVGLAKKRNEKVKVRDAIFGTHKKLLSGMEYGWLEKKRKKD